MARDGGHGGRGRVDQKPVRVLGKALRDGRRFALYLVPGTAPDQAQMLVLIAGEVVTDPFGAVVQRFTSPVPRLPHTLAVPLTRSGRPTGRTLVGLTGDEADAIGRTVGAWRRRYAAAPGAAAPGAPTWRIMGEVEEPRAGAVLWDCGARRHATVLSVRRRQVQPTVHNVSTARLIRLRRRTRGCCRWRPLALAVKRLAAYCRPQTASWGRRAKE
ncbi:hypothetical protein [Streptomyces murinus]|uniref:hypothetical protein n=1 Tax=Streptomyces murinus TaxID=33900 RepID=UPI003804D0E2